MPELNGTCLNCDPVTKRIALLETLECRRLLSAQTFAETSALAATADRSVAGGFNATINFQPAGLGSVDNTRADFGRLYGQRGNGLSYGWNRDLEADGDMIDRDSTRDLYSLTESAAVGNGPAGELQTVDERYDTLAQVEVGDAWSIDVPDDRLYALAVVVGDPDFAPGVGFANRTVISVNDELFIEGESKRYWPYAEATGYVEPGTDGRITLNVVPNSLGGSILWVRVAEVEAFPTYDAGESIDWTQLTTAEALAADVPNSPVPRAEGGGGVVGDELVLIGGFEQRYVDTYKRVDIVNLETGDTRSGTEIPETAADTHAAEVVDETRGVIHWIAGTIGNESGLDYDHITDTAWTFDPDGGTDGAGSWTQLPDLPAERAGAAAIVVGDALHVLGGSDDTGVLAQNEHWMLDLTDTTADWQIMPPLPFGVVHTRVEVLPTAAEFGGPLLVVTGGEYDHGLGYSTVRHTQLYDVEQASWTLGQPSPQDYSHNTSLVIDGDVWVVGGQSKANEVAGGVFSYDAADDVWVTHTNMPQDRKIGVPFFDEEDDRIVYIAGDTRNEGFVDGVLLGVIDFPAAAA